MSFRSFTSTTCANASLHRYTPTHTHSILKFIPFQAINVRCRMSGWSVSMLCGSRHIHRTQYVNLSVACPCLDIPAAMKLNRPGPPFVTRKPSKWSWLSSPSARSAQRDGLLSSALLYSI